VRLSGFKTLPGKNGFSPLLPSLPVVFRAIFENYKGKIEKHTFQGPSMFEHHREPLLPKRYFLKRVVKYALISLGLILGSPFSLGKAK
jgi:hypothetical protein